MCFWPSSCSDELTTYQQYFMANYLLGKGGYVLVALVSLSVCLSVDNITQKVMNGLG